MRIRNITDHLHSDCRMLGARVIFTDHNFIGLFATLDLLYFLHIDSKDSKTIVFIEEQEHKIQ